MWNLRKIETKNVAATSVPETIYSNTLAVEADEASLEILDADCATGSCPIR